MQERKTPRKLFEQSGLAANSRKSLPPSLLADGNLRIMGQNCEFGLLNSKIRS
jgi:hypothetical protein